MKSILVVFSALTLLIGCQTFAAVKNVESEKQQLKQKELPMVRAAKPVFCGDANELLKVLSEQHNEAPILIFNEGPVNTEMSQVVIFVNIKKGTVSVVEKMSSGYACMITHGSDAMLISVPKGDGV